MEMSGVMGVRIQRTKTNLVIQDGIVDISGKSIEFICIPNIVDKPCNLALFC